MIDWMWLTFGLILGLIIAVIVAIFIFHARLRDVEGALTTIYSQQGIQTEKLNLIIMQTQPRYVTQQPTNPYVPNQRH